MLMMPGGGLDGEIHRTELREAAVVTVALTRGVNEAGEVRREVLVAEAETFGARARGVVFKDHV